MLEQFSPQPDDTVEIAAVPARRAIALIVSAAVVTLGVLVGVGFLAFGGIGDGGGGHVQTPGLLPAISSTPDISAPPSPGPTSTPTTAPTEATTAPPLLTTTATLTPTTLPAGVVSIVNATMKPPAYQGANCPGSTTGVATVVANGPMTITYRWASAAITSPAGVTASFTFIAAGSHQFFHSFTNITTPNGQLNAAFVVVTPVARRASMTYTQKCGASASKITPKITKDASLSCSVTFTSTIHAGVGPMTVNYHWEISGAGPGGDSSSWTFPHGGGNHQAVSSIRPLERGSSMTATLVLGTPVRFVTATVRATCP